jgi:hypothetical protein
VSANNETWLWFTTSPEWADVAVPASQDAEFAWRKK